MSREADSGPPSKMTKNTCDKKKLSDAEYEVLISEVQSRPCLWNDCHADFKNTVITRKLWNEIGESLDLTGEDCKKKWKNMKDKFRKILQKPDPKSGSAAESATPKWKFYELMMFTKDVVAPSSTVGNLQSSRDDSLDDCTMENDQGEPSATEPSQIEPSQTELRHTRPHRSKSVSAKCEMEKRLILLEEKKVNAIMNLQDKEEKSDDYHFLISLLPFLKNFDPIEKLEVRLQMQTVVMEAYKKHEIQKRQQSASRPHSNYSNYQDSPLTDINNSNLMSPGNNGPIYEVTNCSCIDNVSSNNVSLQVLYHENQENRNNYNSDDNNSGNELINFHRSY